MVLILGYGLIGKALYRSIIKVDTDVKVFSDNIEDQPEKNFYRGNYRDIGQYEKLFEDVTTIVHLLHSTVPYSSQQDPLSDLETNVSSTISMLEILKSRPEINMVYISSGGAAYGLPRKDSVTEEHATNPISPYGISKLVIEQYLYYYSHCYGMKSTILRPSNIYGAEQDIKKPQGVVGHIINCIKRDVPFCVWGDGNSKKDYLFVDDLVDAIRLVISGQRRDADVFNVARGECYSVHEIIKIVEKCAGKKLRTEKHKSQQFDVQQIILDGNKFRDEYNWEPKVHFPSVIQSVFKDMNG